jgi:hypothetical protein
MSEAETRLPRAERRAAPKPARVPSGDRPTYSSDEGQTSTGLRLLLIVIGLALLIVIPFAAWLFQQDLPSLTIMIGDSEVHRVQLGALTDGQRFGAITALFAAIVAVLIIVPFVLMVVCATVLVSVVLGIGLPLLLVAAILLVVLSPLLLLLALARWIWRASAARAPLSGVVANG